MIWWLNSKLLLVDCWNRRLLPIRWILPLVRKRIQSKRGGDDKGPVRADKAKAVVVLDLSVHEEAIMPTLKAPIYEELHKNNSSNYAKDYSIELLNAFAGSAGGPIRVWSVRILIRFLCTNPCNEVMVGRTSTKNLLKLDRKFESPSFRKI